MERTVQPPWKEIEGGREGRKYISNTELVLEEKRKLGYRAELLFFGQRI